MSLIIEIDKWDYKEAVGEVERILAKIKAFDDDGEECVIDDLPSAEEIVDAIWEKIK